jgi:hypothetical protein
MESYFYCIVLIQFGLMHEHHRTEGHIFHQEEKWIIHPLHKLQ